MTALPAAIKAARLNKPDKPSRSDDPRDYVDKRLPPRIRKAIESMIFEGNTRSQAAASVGLKDNTLLKHLQSPIAARYYSRQLEVLRTSEKARNVHVATVIRESNEPGKTRIEAMKYIDGAHEHSGPNVQVNVGVQVRPGYIVDISQHAEKAAHILQVSGSKRNAIEEQ